MITPTHYMLLSAALFMIGVIGVLLRRNIIIIFMSIELILNAVNINLVAFSKELQHVGRTGVRAVRDCRGGGRGGSGPRHHPGVLSQQGDGQRRRDEPDAVVGEMEYIWLIPLLPGLGAASQRPRRDSFVQRVKRPGRSRVRQ